MSNQAIEQEVMDYLEQNFNADDWDVPGIVDEVLGRGCKSIDDMDADDFLDVIWAYEI